MSIFVDVKASETDDSIELEVEENGKKIALLFSHIVIS